MRVGPWQVVNREQLLTAVYSALQAASAGTLKTKTLHSEVLLSLHPAATVRLTESLGVPSGSDNLDTIIGDRLQPQINEALRKFGISATTKNLLLVRIGSPSGSSSSDPTRASMAEHEQRLVDGMSDLVQGEMTSLSRLGEEDVDWKSLKKVRFTSSSDEHPAVAGAPVAIVLIQCDLICSRALRSCTSSTR